ncbi:MAG: phage tail protein [Deltaproteobacteria bacterium]|nr:phage tail protein [Deltaproteobacteria bacterium]
MAATGQRVDHQSIAFFKVEVDGIEGAKFRGCSGLKSETEVFEYQEGGNNTSVYKLAGPTKAGNIVLRQGFVSDPALFKWRDEIHNADGKGYKRRNGAIVALGPDGKTEMGRWSFEKAWPTRWEMGEWDTTTGQALVETLEIAVERISRAK